MAKKMKIQPVLKQYEMKDPKQPRTLRMHVEEENVRSFEVVTSFVQKVQLASKIEDVETGQVYKNKLPKFEVIGAENE